MFAITIVFSDIPNVTKETIDVAENVKSRLAEDVHSYYTYELRTPNYASRLHKMSSIVSAVDVSPSFIHLPHCLHKKAVHGLVSEAAGATKGRQSAVTNVQHLQAGYIP